MMNYFQKKKLAFMSIVNKVKGFVRTITGALPLTLEGCVDEESIIDYTLYGQSVQDGTPAPEAPVEVESVGEKTTNLINWDLILSDTTITKVENGYYSTSYFHNFDSTHAITKQIKEVLKPNVTYTLSRRCSVGYVNGSVTGNIVLYGSGGTKIVESGYGSIFRSSTFSLTQEQIDDIRGMYIYFYNKDCTIFNLQLTEGDTVLPYEPYGYKIPVKVSGKNLYNKNIDEKIVISASGTTRYGVKINSCNEPITVSGLYKRADFIAYKIIKDGIYSTYREMPILPHTITDTGDTLVLYFGAEASKFSEGISNLQIEYGYTATDYEPYHETTTNIYLDEPLRKVPNSDCLYYENQICARRVKEYICKGNEEWYKNGEKDGLVRYLLSGIVPVGTAGQRNILTNMYPHINNYLSDWWQLNTVQAWGFRAQAGWIGVCVSIEDFPTVTDFKNFVATKYSEGNPLKMYFGISATETPITLPTIPTFKGTSIISADTTIQPSNAEIEYYSNVKE